MKTIIGPSLRTSNAPGDGDQKIGPFWQKFFSEDLSRIPGRIGSDFYGVYTEYEGDYTKPYTLITGVEVEPDTEPPDGMVKIELPETAYEIFEARGEMPLACIEAWQKIWLADKELGRAYTLDYERHHADGVDIYIALSK